MLGHNLSRVRALFPSRNTQDNERELLPPHLSLPSTLLSRSNAITANEACTNSRSLESDPQYLLGSHSGPLPVVDDSTSEPWFDDNSRRIIARRMSAPPSNSVLVSRSVETQPVETSGTDSDHESSAAYLKRKFSELVEEAQSFKRRGAARTPSRLDPEKLYNWSDVPGLSDDSDSDDMYELDVPPPQYPTTTLAARQAARVNRFRPNGGQRLSLTVPATLPHKFLKDVGKYSVFLTHVTQHMGLPNDGSSKRWLKYLPLVPSGGRWRAIPRLKVASAHCHRVDGALERPVNATWPPCAVPIELFLLITGNLAREDVKNMRLVNREFEEKVSASLFHTLVVPFSTDLYDMLDDEVKQTPHDAKGSGFKTYKGKGKQKAKDGEIYVAERSERSNAEVRRAKDGKMHQRRGLRVFQGFGPHMRRFGMSFELSEREIADPEGKTPYSYQGSYHGQYWWPPKLYRSFGQTAALEQSAEEQNRMTSAFANLINVNELALSVDSGLGWMTGPDISVHHQIFKKSTPIFGPFSATAGPAELDGHHFWAVYKDIVTRKYSGCDPKETRLMLRQSKTREQDLDYSNAIGHERYWSDLDMSLLHPELQSRLASAACDTHLLYPSRRSSFRSDEAVWLPPNDLRRAQEEWLLETGWAQRAFLDTYMMAIINNQHIFGNNVTKLHIANLSSGFVSMFMRSEFWSSLATLNELILRVSPDHRVVDKDPAGHTQTMYRHPSNAVNTFHQLAQLIGKIESIKTLGIGWAAGGEHETGVFGRNRHVLPAPITNRSESLDEVCRSVTVFPHVKHFTLMNCWLAPTTLEYFVAVHAKNSALEKLSLDSVSLVAPPDSTTATRVANAIQTLEDLENQRRSSNEESNARNARACEAPNVDCATYVGPIPVLAPGCLAQMSLGDGSMGYNLVRMFATNFLAGMLPGAMHPAPPPLPLVPTSFHWSEGHRGGSWPLVLNAISPGPRFTDYLQATDLSEEQPPPRPLTNLLQIELKSCGYARLNNLLAENLSSYVQNMFDEAHLGLSSTWFEDRAYSLAKYMLGDHDLYTAQIVQHMPEPELDAVLLAWGLFEGWEDAEKAEEPTYDGRALGGTGRISGTITHDMALVTQATNE